MFHMKALKPGILSIIQHQEKTERLLSQASLLFIVNSRPARATK